VAVVEDPDAPRAGVDVDAMERVAQVADDLLVLDEHASAASGYSAP